MLASFASLALLVSLWDGARVAAYFTTTWTGLNESIILNQNTVITYSTDNFPGNLDLVLCQTSGTGALDESNTWSVFSIITPCDHAPDATTCYLNPPFPESLTINLSTTGAASPSLENFFFCWAFANNHNLKDITCQSFSPLFNVQEAQTSATTPSTQTLPITNLHISSNQAVLKDTLDSSATVSNSDQPTVATALSTSSSSSPSSVLSTSSGTSTIITTGTSSAIATETVTPTPVAATAPSSSSKGGLPIGAKVGIPIAAAAFALMALFFAMACLRRRRSKNHSRSKKAMLTSDMHELGSRDLLAEKEAFTNSSLDETHPSQTRLYDSPAPTYSSTAGHRTSRPPQLNPLSLTPQFEMSRNPSSASAAISARTTNSSTSRGLERMSHDGSEEPYTDVPIYGDARHSPQVFPAGGSTFFSEPGMSQEELARLEDEERRIDEAIAAAERARR